MPFESKRQWRAAFAGKIPGISPAKAHEWAHETPGEFKDLPDRAPAEKGKPTLRSKKSELLAHAHDSGSGIAKSQLHAGEKVELEHTIHPAVAKQIAIDHLRERPDYYGLLEAMEKHAPTSKRANGDMLQYFMDHPDKLREKREREAQEKKAALPKAQVHQRLRKIIESAGVPIVPMPSDAPRGATAFYYPKFMSPFMDHLKSLASNPNTDAVTARKLRDLTAKTHPGAVHMPGGADTVMPEVLAHEFGHAKAEKLHPNVAKAEAAGKLLFGTKPTAAGAGFLAGASTGDQSSKTREGVTPLATMGLAGLPLASGEGQAWYHGTAPLREAGGNLPHYHGINMNNMALQVAPVVLHAGGGYAVGRTARALVDRVRHREKKANFKLHGERDFRGLDIAIENKKGSERKWYDPYGKEKGSTHMHYDYGYIRLTEGTDGDHVDVYIGPDEDAENVFIVDQMKKPDFKTFDEQKCMLGFKTEAEAKAAYLKQYDDPRFFGSIKSMPVEEFKMKVLDKKNHGEKIAVSDKFIHRAVRSTLDAVEDAPAKKVKDVADRLGDMAERLGRGSTSSQGRAAGIVAKGHDTAKEMHRDLTNPKVDWKIAQAKVALNLSTVQSALAQRAAQGIGGAAALGRGIASAAEHGATTSRGAMQQLGGLAKHQLSAVAEGGTALRKTEQALANPVTQAAQGRVLGAIRDEAAGAATRTGAPLSNAYEGYMTSSQNAYSPEHLGQVLGTAPVHLKNTGPSQLATQVGTAPGARSAANTVVTPRSGIRPRAGMTEPTVLAPTMIASKIAASAGWIREKAVSGLAKRNIALGGKEQAQIARKAIDYSRAKATDVASAGAARQELRDVLEQFKKTAPNTARGGRRAPGGYSAGAAPGGRSYDAPPWGGRQNWADDFDKRWRDINNGWAADNATVAAAGRQADKHVINTAMGAGLGTAAGIAAAYPSKKRTEEDMGLRKDLRKVRRGDEVPARPEAPMRSINPITTPMSGALLGGSYGSMLGAIADHADTYRKFTPANTIAFGVGGALLGGLGAHASRVGQDKRIARNRSKIDKLQSKEAEDSRADKIKDRMEDLGLGILAAPAASHLAEIGTRKLMLRGGRLGGYAAMAHGPAEAASKFFTKHVPEHATELGGLAVLSPALMHPVAHGIDRLLPGQKAKTGPQDPLTAGQADQMVMKRAEEAGRLIARGKVAVDLLGAGRAIWRNRGTVAGLGAVGAVGAGLYGAKKTVDAATNLATTEREPARYAGVSAGMRPAAPVNMI